MHASYWCDLVLQFVIFVRSRFSSTGVARGFPSTSLGDMQASSPLVAFFEARMEYLTCINSSKFGITESLAASSTLGMLKLIADTKYITIADATKLTRLLESSPLAAESIVKINNAIQGKVDIVGTDVAQAKTPSKTKQSCTNIEMFQSSSDWAIYRDAAASDDSKIMNMAKRMISIGLTSPTEHTIAGAAAVALHGAQNHSVSYLLLKVRLLKQCLQVPHAKFADAPPIYPSNVCDFKASHPVLFESAFANDPPSPCPIDSTMLQMMKQHTPCRATKSGCDIMTPSFSPTNKHMGKTTLHNLLKRLPTSMGIDLPGFQWCVPGALAAVAPAPPVALALAPSPSQAAGTPTLTTTEPAKHLAVTSMIASSVPTSAPPHAGQKPIQDGTDTVPVPATVAPASSLRVSDMVAKYQARALAAKAAGDDAADGDKSAGARGTKHKAIVKKRPSAAPPAAPKRPKAEPKTSGKLDDSKAVFDTLRYEKGKQGPRYYGVVTVYSADGVGGCWRVKPCKGSRVDVKFKWRITDAEDRKQWAEVVKHIKSLKQ